jgi:hypothetical protein
MGAGKLALAGQPYGNGHGMEDYSHHGDLPICSIESENHRPRTPISTKTSPDRTHPAHPPYFPHSASSPQNSITETEDQRSSSREPAANKLKEPLHVAYAHRVQLITAHCPEHSSPQCSSHGLLDVPPNPTSLDVSFSSSRKRRVSESEVSETGRLRGCEKRGKQNQRSTPSIYSAKKDNSEAEALAPRPLQESQIKQELELEVGMDGEENEDRDSDIVLLNNEYDALMDYNRQLLLIEQLNLQRGPHG